MSIGTLYIGTQDYDFSQLDTESLTKDNYESARSGWRKKDYHTSIEDLNLKIEECSQLVKDCNNIELLDWEILTSPDYPHRLIILGLADPFSNGNSELADFLIKTSNLNLASRTTDDPVLWAAGCSFTWGFGVEDNERFSHLVATELGLEEVNIAMGGYSIWNASDQILRADIRKGDIVVWGLTSVARVEVILNGVLRGVTPCYYTPTLDPKQRYYTLDYFDSPLIKMKWGRQILQVLNFCNKIGAKLVLVNLLDWDNITNLYLKDKNVSYLDLKLAKKDWLDIGGGDREHPGPKQHQQYATEIIKCIQGE